MNALHPSSYATLTIVTLSAVLTGCGGSQPPISAPGFGVSDRTIISTSESNNALIYASNGCKGTCVLSYPSGKVVDSIAASGGAPCSDGNGNVFIPSSGRLLEYQHGTTSLFWTYNLPGTEAAACSIEPTQGYPAIVFRASGEQGDIVIFNNGIYYPTVYSSGIESKYCGYDDTANLFVSGLKDGQPAISELKSGQSSFIQLSVVGRLGHPGHMQWDGKYMTYESIESSHVNISQLSISGSVATVVRTIHLKGKVKRATQSWIYDGKVSVPFSTSKKEGPDTIGIWPYPQGGKPDHIFKLPRSKALNIFGLTIST